jgi:hypothetical protein
MVPGASAAHQLVFALKHNSSRFPYGRVVSKLLETTSNTLQKKPYRSESSFIRAAISVGLAARNFALDATFATHLAAPITAMMLTVNDSGSMLRFDEQA